MSDAMLSMHPMSADQAGYYLGLAREDYYLEGGEPQGRWFGSGSEQLKLGEAVLDTQLYNLFDGKWPDGKRSMLQRQSPGSHHLPGWDLTFSAPKSVSVFWSQAPPEVRAIVQDLHDQAVKAALGFLQDTSMFTRRGPSGERLEHVGMVAALFEHSTSRAMDPHLHTHALVMNVSLRQDGTTGAASSMHLFESKMVAGALYRAELAMRLEQALGLPIRREQSWFEIDGVGQPLMDFFSKRREEIVGELERRGLSSAQAAAAVAIETRDSKTAISRPLLFEDWHAKGESHNWSTQEALRLIGSAPARSNHDEEPKWALERARDRLTVGQAHFCFRDFTRALAEEAQGTGMGCDQVVKLSTEHLAWSPDIVRLGEHNGVPRFTTAAMYEIEADLLEDAAALHKTSNHQVSVERTMRFLKNNHTVPGGKSEEQRPLSAEQMQAVYHLCHESNDIAVLSGLPGAGKTTVLKSAKALWESQGYDVIGTSLYSRASRELMETSGIKSKNIAKLLHEIDPDPDFQRMFESEREVIRSYGPDISQPFRKLARLYGPDILHPLRGILDQHGPNIMQPIVELADKYGPNILAPLEKHIDNFTKNYAPDIGQLWRSLGDHLAKKLDEIRERPITAKTILVVDEAGTVATPEMGKLVSACRQAGAKIVTVGDERQTQPIGPGAPFAAFGTLFGKAELEDIQRQDQQWERKALKELAAGQAKDLLKSYSENGRISISETQKDCVSQLISDWQEAGMPINDTILIARTNREVSQLNRMAQQVREAMGLLGQDCVHHGEHQFHVGDKVMFTANSKPRGIENRGTAVVIGLESDEHLIRLKLENDRRVTIALDDFQHVTLGYATTTQGAQGATVKNAYVLMGGSGQDREQTLVQLSRAEVSTRIYTTREQAGDDLADLAKKMEQSHRKSMAHDVEYKDRPDRGIRI